MRQRIIGLAALALLATGASVTRSQTASPGAEAGEIKMTAKKYAFDPGVIRVKKGDHVKLVITALDHDHGFKLDAFKIDQQLKRGEAVTVEFAADEPGTFSFECSHFCGMGHRNMKGEL